MPQRNNSKSSKRKIRTSKAGSIGDAIKASIKNALHSALAEEWSEVTEQLKKNVYVTLDGYERCELRVVDGYAGEEWWTSKLSDIVTQYISHRDGWCGPEESDWCDAIALDMEKQAKRLRGHADKLRSGNNKDQQ